MGFIKTFSNMHAMYFGHILFPLPSLLPLLPLADSLTRSSPVLFIFLKMTLFLSSLQLDNTLARLPGLTSLRII
jgi:hypothetical protein